MDATEYSRREKFLNALRQLGEPEFLEILRLLQKKNIHYSENANGVFLTLLLSTKIHSTNLNNLLNLSGKTVMSCWKEKHSLTHLNRSRQN